MSHAPVVGVTFGDPNGIGPEIAVAVAKRYPSDLARVILFGDEVVARRYLPAGDTATLRVIKGDSLLPAPAAREVDLVAVEGLPSAAFIPGKCNAASGRATVRYLEAAVNAAAERSIDAIVGCPHNETAIHAAGVRFDGYPGLLADLAGVAHDKVLLLLSGAGLNVVHVTLHERLVDAVSRLTADLVHDAGVIAITAMRHLGERDPRLGVFGINPHAGENGLFGDDDERVTRPAVARLVDEGFCVSGPAGADLLLSERKCDVYLAMYHDQGHIPVKLLAGRDAVAFSIGSDFVFASVGHGSAPNIAGSGAADPLPLMHAVDGVCRLCA